VPNSKDTQTNISEGHIRSWSPTFRKHRIEELPIDTEIDCLEDMEVVVENLVHIEKQPYPMGEEKEQSGLETIAEVTLVEEEGTAEVFKNMNEMENANDMEVELPALVTQQGWKKVLSRKDEKEREAILQARNHLVIFRFEQEQKKVAAMKIQKQFQV
jgi:hypothetical protein